MKCLNKPGLVRHTDYWYLNRAKFLILVSFLIFPFVAFCQPVKIACIGNSVTYGYGHTNPGISSYPAQLQALLGSKYLVKNFGRSGATLLSRGHNPYDKTKEYAAAIDFAPDVAVIHLGLNDTDPRNWPNYKDEFAADYSRLIEPFRKANPQVKVYICKLTPIFSDHPRFKSGTREWYWQIQKLIPEIASANQTKVIDLHTPLYSRPDLFADALHPNEAGASIIAKTVYQQITGDYGLLKLAPVFNSRMVLQRGRPIKFYGWASAGEKIVARFNSQQKTVITSEQGKWEAVFPAMPAGGPFIASFENKSSKLVLEDILIGEVWLCSGQSNMYFPLQTAINDAGEMKSAQSAGNTIRLLKMKPLAETDNISWDSTTLEAVNELNYFSGKWQPCDSINAKEFSAVAYYFGKQLQQQLKVPIGLIEVAVGGSTTESWIDRYSMEHHPVLVNELYNWRKSDFFMPWVRERADINLKNATNPKQRHPYEPSYNFEAGIRPLVGFPIAGVIWYQGESNTQNVELHEIVFPELVKSWRKNWGYEFPFYYVQLSSINRPTWTDFRYSQLKLLSKIPNSGMAVSSDMGDSIDVHPRNKKPVGDRLARLALHYTYGQTTIVPYGPMPLSAEKQKDRIIVQFKYSASLKTSDGKALRGFTFVNKKGFIMDANAQIQNNRVVIRLQPNEDAQSVLYGWKPFTNANLVNAENLPASTFKIKLP